MKKFLQLLVSCLFLSVFVAGCTAEIEDAGSVELAADIQPCNIQVHSVPGVVFNAGFTTAIARVNALNSGWAACPYKVSFDFYKPVGNVWLLDHSSSVISRPAIETNNISPVDTQQDSASYSRTPSVLPCKYKIWYKFKNQYPNGSETWHQYPTNGSLWDC